MGAESFYVDAKGKTAKEAFKEAREQALYDYGHRGYTGTLAEKDDFTEIKLPEGNDPYDYAQKLVDDCDERIDDKWGPAGCFDLGEGNYFFFGWASA